MKHDEAHMRVSKRTFKGAFRIILCCNWPLSETGVFICTNLTYIKGFNSTCGMFPLYSLCRERWHSSSLVVQASCPKGKKWVVLILARITFPYWCFKHDVILLHPKNVEMEAHMVVGSRAAQGLELPCMNFFKLTFSLNFLIFFCYSAIFILTSRVVL